MYSWHPCQKLLTIHACVYFWALSSVSSGHICFYVSKVLFFNYHSLVIQTEIRKCKASRSDTRVGITLNLELTLDSMGILSVLIIPINGHWCLFVTSLISSIKPPNLGYRSFTGSLCQIYFEYFTFQYCCSLDCFPFLNRLLLVYRNRRNFVQQ